MPDFSKFGGVEMTSTIDLSGDIQRRLMDAERAVLTQNERAIMAFISSEWVGWTYANRPVGAPRLVSHDAWKSTIGTTTSEARLTITNTATGKNGKEYAGYIHRAGTTKLEWERLWETLQVEFLPRLEQDLLDEVQRNVFTPANPRKIRGSVGSAASARNIGRSV